ncbi:DUF3124 domain-containing protein [Methylococcus sp. EFPC2]|uniref:DUF3124 domain-containing protein n=1 Tax=Methylococcus sp. EFPC2 TaxID=2812648 RepID=UPI0019671CA7|nr:DUF3124 domain-containing protein [Methylococcus sp. EFPC2]QSA98662.1 DUF3124 domain-containing protein [Methylococcus sp. EFPC2]
MTKRTKPPMKHLAWAVLPAVLFSSAWNVLSDEKRSRGQLLYVPVYSEVPYGDKGLTLNLTATLSLRNTDSKHRITVDKVDYYSSTGKLVRSYLSKPVSLEPLASVEHVVRESDRSGGISASFLVEWESAASVSVPYVEVLMINSTYNQGIAFNSPARVLEEKP